MKNNNLKKSNICFICSSELLFFSSPFSRVVESTDQQWSSVQRSPWGAAAAGVAAAPHPRRPGPDGHHPGGAQRAAQRGAPGPVLPSRRARHPAVRGCHLGSF